jgi:hypothetical protein
MPDYCAFAHSKKRDISASFYRNAIGLTMSEKNFCHARVLTSNVVIIAQLIDLWLEQNSSIEQIKLQFTEVEIFERFPFEKKDKKLQKKWNEVKNAFFKGEFSSETLHYDICTTILEQAKKDMLLAKMFPYISVGRLCFSNRANGFSNYLCIAPTRWEPINERYFVNLPPDNENIQIAINDLSEALNVLKQNIHRLGELPDEYI